MENGRCTLNSDMNEYIQALRLYTSSVSTETQCAVLRLLQQLVACRVNYNLLDAENKFIDFITKQLEQVEDGNLREVGSVAYQQDPRARSCAPPFSIFCWR